MSESQPSDIVAEALGRLEAEEKAFIQRGLKMLEADHRNLFLFDLLAIGAINRCIQLSAGFRTLVSDGNCLCAWPLIRLQLDTALRFFAGFLVDNPNEFVMSVLRGEHIRDLRDTAGKRMTDRYLVDKMSESHGWIATVYEHTSSFVHLSDVHLFHPVVQCNDDTRELDFCIGNKQQIPEESCLEGIQAFHECMSILALHIEGWTFTKDNPALIAQMRAVKDAGEATA